MAILKKLFGPVDGEETAEENQIEEASKEVEAEEIEETDEGEVGQLALDVYQNKDNVIIKSTIAGVKPEDLDITIANDMVTIRGERTKQEEIKGEDYFYQECYWGGFYRSLPLPLEVDVDKAVADLKDGILTITLPKAAKAKTKKVRIKNAAE